MDRSNSPEMMEAWQEAVQAETKTSPWFVALLLQKRDQLFTRFAHFYAQLRAMPRKMRRQFKVSLATAALILALSSYPTPAHAASISVTPGAAGINNGDGCSLVEAIINANDDAATHAECTAGSGADTIVLAGNTYSYTTATGTESALPNITSEITIEGNGATIQRPFGANMRIIRINSGGNLTLNNATITGGSNVLYGGGIYNGGTLTLNNSAVSGNTASYGGGISSYSTSGNCAAAPGLTVNSSTVSGNTATNQGGGIFNINGVAQITHSTITANTALANTGAGVRSWNDGFTCTRVGGSIIAGNLTGGDVAANSTTQRFQSLGYNLIGTAGNNVDFAQEFNTTGDITNNVAPGLGPLADNGGPTLTHALVSGSPAIDIAPTGSAGTTDQRGAARDFDGNGAASANEADAGAVEFRAPVQNCTLSTGSDIPVNGVTFNFSSLGTLSCVTVEEMGTNHPMATGSIGNPGIHTGNWWHISGNVNSGFNVDITLPYGAANGASRVCQWPGNMGGFGWNCGPLDGTGTSYVADTSVTRSGLSSFSDWAVGDEVGPTAVTLQSITAISQQGGLAALIATLLTALSGVWLWARRPGQTQNKA